MDYVKKMDRFGREITTNKLTDDEGFLIVARDFDTLTGTQNLYVSVSMLRQLAQRNPELGLSPRAELDEQRDINVQLVHALEQTQAERDELKGALESYKAGFEQVVGRKPPKRAGRPPAKAVA